MTAALRAALVTASVAIGMALAAQANACGFHPRVPGGFQTSYPGALAVAVAVANARREGLLPGIDERTSGNEDGFLQALADLNRLRSRLEAGRRVDTADGAAAFSLVLVGPALWSHYHMASTSVLARFHANGPLDGKVVVLTHQSVLRALLNGELTLRKARELGLLAISGNDSRPVMRAFEFGFQSRA